MNIEVCDINIENKAKELSEKILKKAIKSANEKDVIKRMAKDVAKEALFEIENRGKDRRLHNTRLLMKNYNILNEHINGDGGEVKIKFESLDEEDPYMKVEFMWLESIARSKARTAKILKYIDDKLVYLKNQYNENKEYEKYRAFEMFFIEDRTSEEIQEEIGCGKNSPKKWCDKVINELSILLWGIDALNIK